MNAVSAAIRPYAEGFKSLEPALTRSAPAWLTALRREAFARFANRGFPGEREEDWKYTSTRPLEKRGFAPSLTAPGAMDADVIEPVFLREMPAHTRVFINGRHVPALGTVGPDIAGLHITNLAKALQQASDKLQAYFAPVSAWGDDPFTALNTAFLQDGVILEIEDGVRLEQPLQLIFLSTKQAQPGACHPRILVRLGRHAHATLLETYHGLEEAANLTNGYAQIHLGENAQLEHLRVQRESTEDFHVSRVRVAQQQGSRYVSHTLNLGGLWVRTDLSTRLEAPEAEAVFNGLYWMNQGRHVDNHTRIDHLAPGTRSDELYRGIIGGHSRAVFNGKVVVAKHAVKTDAAQINNNLLLSRQAEIDTKPELEIYADDVKCSHGASIGQLDEQALFYLYSRGLDPETARDLLVGAFAHAVLDRIAAPELQAFARRQLAAVMKPS
ncbi:MAG: Fe-S cluster assembly protein SufD [Gammaproteobacteria bacterium]